jgi:hypothetical protein
MNSYEHGNESSRSINAESLVRLVMENSVCLDCGEHGSVTSVLMGIFRETQKQKKTSFFSADFGVLLEL